MAFSGRSTTLGLLLSTAWLLLLPQGVPGAPGSAEEPPLEVQRARTVLRALESGRVDEARIEAEAAVKYFPNDGPLRRRLAQAHLAAALLADVEFGKTYEDVVFARDLRRISSYARRPDYLALLKKENDWRPEEHRRFMAVIDGPEMARFQQRARQELAESGPLLERRSRLLRTALAEVKEARRLGDLTTELELTALWCQAIVLLWRSDAEQLEGHFKSPLRDPKFKDEAVANFSTEALRAALAAFNDWSPESVFKAAASLARSRPSDPAALAGTADIISLVADLAAKPDPLRSHILAVVDHRYLKDAAQFQPAATAAAREAARQLYEQSRDAKEADVVTSPGVVALQLYEQALKADRKRTLPFLRLRVYLLRLAFDREGARALLDEVARAEPKNAVVPLERARSAFLLEGKPAEGLAFCREAARLPQFSRSYLTAAPAALRTALRGARGLWPVIEKGWPAYAWLFTSLQDLQHSQQTRGDQAGLAETVLLQAGLAGPLCGAPDYPDQARGVNQKTLALLFLIRTKDLLSPEQKSAAQARLEEHARNSALVPRRRIMIRVTTEGLLDMSSPRVVTGVGKKYLGYCAEATDMGLITIASRGFRF